MRSAVILNSLPTGRRRSPFVAHLTLARSNGDKLVHTTRRVYLNKTSRVLALAALVALAGPGLASIKHDDDLLLKLPPGWVKGYFAENRREQSEIMQFIRPGDDIHNWKELLTELSYGKPRGTHKPEEMLDRIKAQREKECPGSTVWNVIESDEKSITYEWHFQSCLDQPEQGEIAKILVGKRTVYFLQYAKKGKELSADERDTWVNWLGEAKLGGSR
jgi:hypothetical protein